MGPARLLPLGAVVALALAGCESSQEKSAQLERLAKLHATRITQSEVTVTRPSKRVEVAATSVLSTSEGAAAIVTLRNTSATALADLPIVITVRDAGGASVYSNRAPGAAHTLVSTAVIPAHGTLTWVDDQVQSSGGAPASLAAEVGEGTPASGAIPQITVSGAHLTEGGAEGSVTNRSEVTQDELVVDAIARRGGRVVAAGRAVLPQLAAGATARFQIFFVGSPAGAGLQVSAPATTTG